MKKLVNCLILLALFCSVSATYAASTWTRNIATPTTATVVAAAGSVNHDIVFGTVEFTAQNAATSAILTNMSSLAGLYVGMPIVFQGTTSTIVSFDSATQITLADTVTDAHATASAGTGTCSYDSALIQIAMTFEAATNGAQIKMYSTSDDATWDTVPFRIVTISDAEAGSAYNFSTHLYQQSYPAVRIVISNPASETGETDDIAVTVKFAGRTNS